MDDNTFECPSCGAKIYPEMTRCPQCGQPVYPEDEDETAEAEVSSPGWITFLGALLIGWLIAGGIAFIINFIVAAFVNPANIGGLATGLLLLTGPIGTIVGSYVAAGIDHPYSRWLGPLIGFLALPVLVLLATHWVAINLRFILNLLVVLSGLATVLAGILGSWLNGKFTRDTGWKKKWQVRGWEDFLYQDLLRKVRFNGSAADRLIEYERQQDPRADRLKLIQNAIERWERDNR